MNVRRPPWAVADFSFRECDEAFMIGERRVENAIRIGARHTANYDPSEEENKETNGMAAVAESMVAKFLGRKWTARQTGLLGPDKGVDVAPNLQVRWTSRHNGKLIVKAHESSVIDGVEMIGVLVRGPDRRNLNAVGWCWIRDAKHDRNWKSDIRAPAWLVGPGSPGFVLFDDARPPLRYAPARARAPAPSADGDVWEPIFEARGPIAGEVSCATCANVGGLSGDRGFCLSRRRMVSTWHPLRCSRWVARA